MRAIAVLPKPTSARIGHDQGRYRQLNPLLSRSG